MSEAESAEHSRVVASAPILIVGSPRSGTTWLQRLLLADPRCCGGQESHFFATFGRAIRDFDRKAAMERQHGLACYWRRSDLLDAIRGLWHRTVGDLVRGAPGALRLVEKTPDHALWLDVIRELLPEARIVHMARDGRAVCASLLAAGRSSWGQGWAPRTLAGAIGVWRRHVEAVLQFPGETHLVRYEDLHDRPVETMRTLWSFVGLSSDDADLAAFAAACAPDQGGGGVDERFRGTGDISLTSSEPLGFRRDGAVDSWRRELGWWQRGTIWRETADLMVSLGYDRDGRARSR